MDRTGNGWDVIHDGGSPLLHLWDLPGTHRRITLHNGAIGYNLCHFILFFNDKIERLDIPGVNEPVDEGGWNPRPLTGGGGWSEHAAAAAADLNWRRHPYNVAALHTFTRQQIKDIHARMRWMNTIAGGEAIEWGGDWPSHPGSTAKPDPMHFQAVGGMKRQERLAKLLLKTPRGRKLAEANKGQRKIIYN